MSHLRKKVRLSDKLTVWNLIMLFLSAYVLSSLFIEMAFDISPKIKSLLYISDNIICIFFMSDFIYHLLTAKSKLGYLKWGWIDFLSGIPYFPFLWYGRFFQLIRVFRAIRSLKMILLVLFENRAKETLVSICLMTFTVLIFSTVVILTFETSPDSNIKDAEDALWWAFTTISTVGYGDLYPVTPAGRMVGVFLMVMGVSMFGAYTAYVASLFNHQSIKEEKAREEKMLRELKTIHKKMEEIESKINKIQK